jgi:uncharacterized protein
VTLRSRTFLLVTFATTWSCYGVAAFLSRRGTGQLPVAAVAFIYAGTLAPAFVATLLAALSRRAGAVRTLLGGLTKTGLRPGFYAFAVGYVLVIKTAAAVAQTALNDGSSVAFRIPWYVFPIAVAVSTPVQAGEEVGWRAFLLPRIAARTGYRRAGLWVGMIWAVWHLPLFFIPGVDLYGQSFALFTLAVVPVSVAMTWLYVSTAGSVLSTMIMHSVNQTTAFVSVAAPASGLLALNNSIFCWTTIVLLWVGAAALFVLTPDRRRGVESPRKDVMTAI